jgi:hypothetical protein
LALRSIRVRADSDTNTYANRNADAYTYTDTDAYSDSNADARAYTDADAGSRVAEQHARSACDSDCR